MTIRVLCVSHTAVSRAAGRLRYQPLVGATDIDLHLVVPERWEEFGRVIVADPPGADGATVHALPVRWPRAWRASWYLHHYPALGALIEELAPDIIHLWEEPWSIVALQTIGIRNRKVPRAAIVMEVDQNICRRLPLPFELIRKRVLKQTDFVMARSTDAVSVVRASGYGGATSLIGYGVDRSVFRPMDRLRARSRFGFSDFIIGYVGRVVREKGLSDAIDALSRTSKRVGLAILGEGPARPELEAQASKLGVGDRVRFLPWGPPEQVAEFIAAADAIILLTRTMPRVKEQFGRVIIEAHACGVPVIGSTCGAIPDVVGAGGWIIPERDANRLAALLDELAGDRLRLEAAGAAGERQVSDRFSFDAIARILADGWKQASQARARSFSSATASRSSLYRSAIRVQE